MCPARAPRPPSPEPVQVVVEDVRGVAEDVGPNGELLVRTPEGLRTVVSGTLRMADGGYC